MRIRPKRWHIGLENFSLILENVARKHTFYNLDALSHHGGRSNFLALAFTNLFHENLGGSQAQQETTASQILHHTRFHSNLHRMTRVRRNDAPPQVNMAGFSRAD